jgi:hypothetical protein
MDFEDDEDEHQTVAEAVVGTGHTENIHPVHNKTKIQDNNHLNEQPINTTPGGGAGQQPDEWEEFEDPNSKYEQLRLKLSRGNNEDNDEDEYYEDENNPINNDDNNNNMTGDRDQQKDKPVWKVNQVKQTETVAPIVEERTEEPPPPPIQKASTGAYRPPQLRSGSSVTIVSGGNQKVSKKKEPNLASTDEFPTLGSTVNKK